MKYLIFIEDEKFTGPVPDSDSRYLKAVLPHLVPLSTDQYFSGLDVILSTAARYSYVLDDKNLLWCIEWEPRFIVVMLSPKGDISAAAISALNPCFGGREASEKELNEFEEQENPQYNLIFDPWDAQFDEDHFNWNKFSVASNSEEISFSEAIKYIETSRLEIGAQPNFEISKLNISEWAKNGIRIVP